MPTEKSTTERRWVDPDDAPRLDRDWFELAELREGKEILGPARADRKKRPPR
jgi:hypothetical protein